MIRCISKVLERGVIDNRNIDNDKCQKCQFLAFRKLNYCFACCSCKLIINNKCLVYIYSLDFPLIIYGKNGQFHIS